MKNRIEKAANTRGNRRSLRTARPNPLPNVEVEWAQINDRQAVVATKDQMYLHEFGKQGDQDPFVEPMCGAGSEATTARLLEGAWCAGIMEARNAKPVPRKSLPGYVWELIGYCHCMTNTPKLMTEAAARFREAGRPDLEAFARRFARLEAGDEKMAVSDLEALGYAPAALLQHCLPPPAAVASIDYFASLVRGPQPLEAFGYCYAGERCSLAISRDDLRAYEELLPPGSNAITCRWHHSGAGGDVAHVKFFIRSVSRLPAPDRVRLVRAVYQAIKFISSLPANSEPGDYVLENLFSKYRHQPEREKQPGCFSL